MVLPLLVQKWPLISDEGLVRLQLRVAEVLLSTTAGSVIMVASAQEQSDKSQQRQCFTLPSYTSLPTSRWSVFLHIKEHTTKQFWTFLVRCSLQCTPNGTLRKTTQSKEEWRYDWAPSYRETYRLNSFIKFQVRKWKKSIVKQLPLRSQANKWKYCKTVGFLPICTRKWAVTY